MRAGQHFHKSFVPRNVDKTKTDAIELGSAKPRSIVMPVSFLRETVWIRTGQGAHKCALAVIDVAGGSDDMEGIERCWF